MLLADVLPLESARAQLMSVCRDVRERDSSLWTPDVAAVFGALLRATKDEATIRAAAGSGSGVDGKGGAGGKPMVVGGAGVGAGAGAGADGTSAAPGGCDEAKKAELKDETVYLSRVDLGDVGGKGFSGFYARRDGAVGGYGDAGKGVACEQNRNSSATAVVGGVLYLKQFVNVWWPTCTYDLRAAGSWAEVEVWVTVPPEDELILGFSSTQADWGRPNADALTFRTAKDKVTWVRTGEAGGARWRCVWCRLSPGPCDAHAQHG